MDSYEFWLIIDWSDRFVVVRSSQISWWFESWFVADLVIDFVRCMKLNDLCLFENSYIRRGLQLFLEIKRLSVG